MGLLYQTYVRLSKVISKYYLPANKCRESGTGKMRSYFLELVLDIHTHTHTCTQKEREREREREGRGREG